MQFPPANKQLARALAILALAFAVASCSDEVESGVADNLSEESQACLMMANSMIDIAREAVADTRSRPERRESRRQLVEDWVARLGQGEDPCSVYEDIGRSSISF